jgi:membrane protease YdiL (CAAX protease family)
LNNSLDRVRRLLPKTSTERAVWIVVSITPGVCEEVTESWMAAQFVRGDAGFGLARSLISSIIFGFAHAHQGRPAILGTGVIGAIFPIPFIFSGSLIPGQVLHAVMNLNNGLALGKVAKRAEV